MINRIMTRLSLGLILALACFSGAQAADLNLDCPHYSQIQSTDFTVPSIWIAPPVAHSLKGAPGVGLGGKEVKELLGVEEATVNHRPGWVCVYKSTGGVSVHEYENKIKSLAETHYYLKRYLKDLTKAYEQVEPYLAKYPADELIGFVGYQKQE